MKALVLLCLLCGLAVAQPTPPGGLTRVNHDASLTGDGKTLTPLGVRLATGGGLQGGGATPLGLLSSCSSGEVLKWSGSAWACGANGAGTVTSVASGPGLTGGPITGAGSLSLVQATTTTIVNAVNIATWGDSITAGFTCCLTNGNYPLTLSQLTGYYVYNGGVTSETSTQIKTRMLAATDKYGWPTILWPGRNNFSSPTAVKADIASMVAALASVGNTNYIVLSILNGDNSSEWLGGSDYITLTTLNNDLAAIYGSHYLDIRAYLVTQYNSGIPQDVIDHGHDVPPSSLRIGGDFLHPNSAGYALIAAYLVGHISILQQGPVRAVTETDIPEILLLAHPQITGLTPGVLPVATSATTIGDSTISKSGSVYTMVGSMNMNTTSSIPLAITDSTNLNISLVAGSASATIALQTGGGGNLLIQNTSTGGPISIAPGTSGFTIFDSSIASNLSLSDAGVLKVWKNTIDMNTHKIVNVVDPASAQDAATKAYVDAHAGTGTVTSVTCSTGLTCTAANPIVAAGTITLANTAVTPASYTNANITVDAQGRITAASNGAGGSGITNSAGNNVLMKSDGTNAIASAETDNGTTFAVGASKFTVGVSSGDVTITGNAFLSAAQFTTGTIYGQNTTEALAFDTNTNGASTANINTTGYNASTTVARSVIFFDGQGSTSGHQILKLDGTNTNVSIPNGSLSVKTTGLVQGVLTAGAGGDSVGSPSTELYVTNAGTTCSEVRDSTNHVESENCASSSGGFVGTYTNHTFHIQTNNTNAIQIDTSQNSKFFGDIQANIHIVGTGSAPTPSSCGSSPAVAGTDIGGQITVGGGATSCTVTFAVTASNTACVLTGDDATSGGYYFTAQSAGAFTFTKFTTGFAGDHVNYHCDRW